MNLYPYRWWLSVVIMITLSVASYLFLLVPQMQDIHNLKAQKQQLMRQLIGLKKTPVKPTRVVPTMNKMEWLNVLPMLAQLNGVTVRSITAKPTKKQLLHENKIKCVVEGSFAQLTRLIVAMHAQTPSALIEHFSYQVTKQQTLLLTLDLLLVDYLPLAQIKISPLTELHTPFCLATNTVAAVHLHDAAVASASITQMKMVGYMAQGEREMALLMLPTGALVEAYVGDAIGLEKGVVVGMTATQLELRLPQGEKRLLLAG